MKMRVEREEEEEQAGEGRGEEEFARTHTCRRTPTWLESEMTEVEDGQTVRKMRRRLGREEGSRKDVGEETKVMRGEEEEVEGLDGGRRRNEEVEN